MTRKIVRFAAGLCAAALLAGAARAEKPNVVVIFADDVGVEAINSYGGEYYTPRLDRMAAEGVRATNAHAMPLCTPSRIRLMTGKYNFRNYRAMMYMHKDEYTIGHLMQDAGYRTMVAGKWQLHDNPMEDLVGATPADAGFDENFIWQLERNDRGSRYWGPTLWDDGERVIVEDMVFGSDLINDHVLEFMRRPEDDPFFIYYTMNLGHVPYVRTPDSMAASTDKEKFAGMITYMDKLVGKVLDETRALDADRRTLVIFTADNGTHQTMTTRRNGTEVKGGKGITTLAGTHVPFIASWQGVLPAGATPEGLIDIMDLLPTLADITGQTLEEGRTDGVSMMPLLSGETSSVRDHIFHHYSPRWTWEPHRYAFDTRWKLYGDGRFYDLRHDPLEQNVLQADGLGANGRHARSRLQNVLDGIDDGPLGGTWTHPDMEK